VNNEHRYSIIWRGWSKIPKQYMSLNGKLVIQYVIDAFQESDLFDKIIVVIDKNYISLLKNVENVIFAPAGKTRNESVKNGIESCPKDSKYVVFHDAARPFIKAKDLKLYIESLKDNSCAITYEPITDALYKENRRLDRKEFKLIQTPEAFRYSLLNKWNPLLKTVAIKEQFLSFRTKYIHLNHSNLKITNAEDIYTAEQLLKYSPVEKRKSIVLNKSILVLGGTGGIGKAVVTQLRDLGAKVVSCGSDFDLSDEKISWFGYWDCIIHSAGAYATDNEGLMNNYDKIMNVNFRSVVSLVENAERLLKPGGSIICIGSTAAAKGRTGISIYSASKAALNTFVEAISPTLATKNISVQVICPAKVNTALQTKINPKANTRDMIQPDALASIVIGYIDIESTGNIVYLRVGQE
jgi:2-C-methyl-D-erythritol 4-phosphate cytidylyltransferase